MKSTLYNEERSQSHFSHDLWPLAPLSSITHDIWVGLPVSRYTPRDNETSGETIISAQILSVGHIEDGNVINRGNVPSVQIRNGNYERFRLQDKDIVVSCRGTILKSALISSDGAGLLASSNLITIRPDLSRLRAEIILAILRAPLWQEALQSRTRSATGLMQLTAKDIATLRVPVPPIHLQDKISTLVNAEEQAYRTAIEVADLRRSLVTGMVAHVLMAQADGGLS